jgi:uncharacterized repeat protein (TIGR01451 family)
MKNMLLKSITTLTFTLLFLFSHAQFDTKSLVYKAFHEPYSESIEDVLITHTYQDKHNQVWHYYGVQKYLEQPLYPAFFDIHMLNDEVIASHQAFVDVSKVKSIVKGILSSEECLMAVAAHLKLPSLSIQSIKMIPSDHAASSKTSWNIPSWSEQTIKAKKAWLFQNNQLNDVWIINLLTPDKKHWYNLSVSAVDGKILDQQDWMLSCQHPNDDGSKHHHPLDGQPGGEVQSTLAAKNTYNVLKIPIESPIHGNHSLVSDPANDGASPFGWHDVNGVSGHEFTITRGNNVYAVDDKDNNDNGGYSPDGGSDLFFDAPFDKSKPASDYLDAAIINLFYMNNIMHDVWYHYGFDEPSGNFQQNNYGKGGTGSDFVIAEAQDGGGNNNANFATPEEGENPRMQMYLWNAAAGSAQLIRVTSPGSIAGGYSGVQAGFSPQLNKTPITGKLILVNSLTSGSLGCDSITNVNALKNNIALIDRGTCTFVEKVLKAQAAGAKAVVVINNTAGAPFSMGGSSAGISIPAIMISQQIGNTFKSALTSNAVNVVLSDSAGLGLKVMDSDFDNGIIAHEYGHGISIRLTGGANNSGCLSNQEQMGEGWSDFFSLVMTHEAGDKGSDSRGIGNYVIAESVNGGGIRTYPYSTNRSVSPYTYDDIKTLSVPHGVGSVWCAMLWDLYWDLIDKYGYDADLYEGKGGNNLAMQLVIDGLKLQPCNPGFEDGRDAILLADRINNKGANQLLIWSVFARRGLGFDADQGSSNSRSDGKEGYQIPPSLKNALEVIKVAEAKVQSGDTIHYRIALKNLTPNVLNNITFNDTLSDGLLHLSTTACPLVLNGNILTMQLDSMLPGDSLDCAYSALVVTPKVTDELTLDNFENGFGKWKIQNDVGLDTFKISQSRKRSGSQSLFIVNPGSQSDQSAIVAYNLDTIENPAIGFYHFYKTEDTWDGAVIELKEKGQSNWIDAGSLFLSGGYNSSISTNPQSRISGQPAFTGASNGFEYAMIDLSDFKGKEVEVRFRFVSDGAASEEGWYIDDVSLMGLSMIRNTVFVNSLANVPSSSSVNTLVYKKESTVSISEINADLIRIYPNPTGKFIHLDFQQPGCRSVAILNTLGEQIYNQENCLNSVQIDLSMVAQGVYFIQVKTVEGVSQTKIVKH